MITGSRADYGLLYWVMKDINNSSELKLQIITTGMHLSKKFGSTYKQIIADGFSIDRKVDLSIKSDTELAICEYMSTGIVGFARSFFDLKPDLVLVLGDRYEIFSAVSAAMIYKIPVAHLHGGERTEGAFDEYIRHSITKMSHLHFTACDNYKNRVIQLGEQPDNVYNFGGLGVDNIMKLKLLSKKDLQDSIGFQFGKKNLLVTFHPVTLEKSKLKLQFESLLKSLKTLKNTKIIFTKTNSDTNGSVINEMIDKYVRDDQNSIAFISMGQLNYLSTMQFVDAVIGNSSSGLIEAPSFKIGTINIGDRQKGRIMAESIITCTPNEKSINAAIKKLYSEKFQKTLNKVSNPYGNGGASKKIVSVLKSVSLDNILKKPFYDIN